MSHKHSNQAEVDANYEVFRKMLPDLMKQHAGKFVVMRHAKTIDFFDTLHDAVTYAARTYPDRVFSVQEVTNQIVDLGWFSHASAYPEVRT